MTDLVNHDEFRLQKLSLGPFGTNTYLLFFKETGESVIVDAPGEADKVIAALEGSTPRIILMTHNHLDHVDALAALKEKFGIPVASHADDAGALPLPPDRHLAHDDVLTFGNSRIRVLHTPGHTPGSLCFLVGDTLISGDTLFPNGPGKTSSPQAFRRIVESITDRLFALPGETRVFPGHGDGTTIAKEKDNYADFDARHGGEEMFGDIQWR